MTKSTALFKILQFGRKEQHGFIEIARHTEAYPIEHARNRMLYELVQNGIKGVRDLLPRMYSCRIDEEGYRECDVSVFVSNDLARNMVEDFAKTF